MPSLQALIRTLTGGDDEQANTAALMIGQFGSDAIPELARLYASKNPDLRWWSIRALAEIQSPDVIPLLKKALRDPEHPVQQCAALGLATHPCPELVPELTGCLSGKDQLLARLAGNALVAIGEDAVPALIEVMARGPQIARLEAIKALAEIKDPRAIPVFFKAIQDGDSALIEHWSEVGLDKLGVGMQFFRP